MKEHGFIFQDWGVRAILAGEKWMTRRIVSPHNSTINGPTCPRDIWAELDFAHAFVDHGPSPAGNLGPYLRVAFPKTDGFQGLRRHECQYRVYPRYQVGDVMWVRETFALSIRDPETMDPDPRNPHDWDAPVYKADGQTGEWRLDSVVNGKLVSEPLGAPPWRSSIHMPRWASRIVRPIVDVGAERVQDISQAQAVAEGWPRDMKGTRCPKSDPRMWFRLQWEDIHGPGAWVRNELVWVPRWEPVEVGK